MDFTQGLKKLKIWEVFLVEEVRERHSVSLERQQGWDKKRVCKAKAGFTKHTGRTRIHLLKPGLSLLDFKVTSKVNLK